MRINLVEAVRNKSAYVQDVKKTIQHLASCSSKIVLVAGAGNVTGQGYEEKYSFELVAPLLSKRLNATIKFVPDCIGVAVAAATKSMKVAEVALLENLFFYPEDSMNDPVFAKSLSSGIDVFVNDDPSSVFVNQSSVFGISEHIPIVATGYSFESDSCNPISRLQKPIVGILDEGNSTLCDLKMWLESNSTFPDRLVISGKLNLPLLHAKHISSRNDPTTTHANHSEITTAVDIIRLAHDRNMDLFLESTGAARAQNDTSAENTFSRDKLSLIGGFQNATMVRIKLQ